MDDTVKGINLKRKVTTWGALSFVIGSVIGSGIFASPKVVMANSGSVGLGMIVWVISAIITITAALSYLELALMIPKSGADYAYYKEAYGMMLAFVWLIITSLFVSSASLAMISITFGNYLVEAVQPGCSVEQKEYYSKFWAYFALAFLATVNGFSITMSTRIQIAFTGAKLLGIAIIACFGIVSLCQGHVEHFKDPFSGTSKDFSSIGTALYGGLFAFGGWDNLVMVTEEIENPNKVLPRALVFGIITVMVCYLSVNVSYLTVLTLDEVKTSTAVAMDLGNRSFGVMSWLIPFFVALSCFGSINGGMFTCSRLFFVGGRDGILPRLLSMLQTKKKTPIPAIVVKCIIPVLMLIPKISNFASLLQYQGFVYWMFSGMTVASVLILRYKQPNAPRPYKVWLPLPIFNVVCVTYLVISAVVKQPIPSLIVLLIMSCTVPIYLVFIKYSLFHKYGASCCNYFTFKMQLLGDLVMPSYEEEVQMYTKEEASKIDATEIKI